MTAKCANPSCDQQFIYFRTGRIFLIDIAGSNPAAGANSKKGPEYFWLCGDCCRTMRVVLDQSGAVAIQGHEAVKPLPDAPLIDRAVAHRDGTGLGGKQIRQP